MRSTGRRRRRRTPWLTGVPACSSPGLSVPAVVVFFAVSYYLIERNTPGEFEGLATRTDALFYTVVTLRTVGYGDVHAAGQAARAGTTVQITFDLVVVGALFAVASAQMVDRLRAHSGRADGRR
ncbi:potassium channel family protein [Jiangella aurantiaca]|uniref:potassium channel family protein n=1 Tax=Jiangella aurantiaca TaxID=2530373 RepID=UPI00193E7C05|nr:potassium channel family protein [Jiangella aurantiaca]